METNAFEIIMEKLQELDVVKDLINIVTTIHEKISALENRARLAEDAHKRTEEIVEKLLEHEKQENIILYNVPESDTESGYDLKIKASEVFQNFMGLHLKPDDIRFVTRVGRQNVVTNKTRPLRVKFNSHDAKARAVRGFGLLKNTPFNASLDFTPTVLQRRKTLLPKMKEARANGQHAVLMKDHLYINGKKLIEVDTSTSSEADSEKSPERLKPQRNEIRSKRGRKKKRV